MTVNGSLFAWLRSLGRNIVRARARDADLSADIQSYVELLTDEHEAAGMKPHEARRTAILELGGVEATKEATRAVRAGALLPELAQDTRYALRMAHREFGFTTAAVLTLALGIGANTAVFSVVNGVLLRPLPYADSGRIVLLQNRDADGAFGVSDRERLIHVTQSSLFSSFSTYQFAAANLIGVGEAERLVGVLADASLFTTLGVVPARGRVFVSDDDQAQPTTAAIISHELWTGRFAADELIIGRTITLNGRRRTIVVFCRRGFDCRATSSERRRPCICREALSSRTRETFTTFRRWRVWLQESACSKPMHGSARSRLASKKPLRRYRRPIP